MAFENPIILNNAGDNAYAMLARDWATNPVAVSYLRLILADSSQLTQTLEIKNRTSFGAEKNRVLSLGQFGNALDKQGLILVIPFNPPLIMDGNTYFIMKVPAFSRVLMMFYYEQNSVI
jgi:hypothetical protein